MPSANRPATCAAVEFDMRDEHYGEPAYDAYVGDLLWNPKAGDGHIIVAEAYCNASGPRVQGEKFVDCGCGGYLTKPEPHTTLVCECGEDDSWRDHHYEILARADGSGDSARSSHPLSGETRGTAPGETA